MQPCAIAQEFLGAAQAGVCPALEKSQKDGGTACGMITRPLFYLHQQHAGHLAMPAHAPGTQEAHAGLSECVARALGAGKGCDSSDSTHSLLWPWPVMLQG